MNNQYTVYKWKCIYPDCTNILSDKKVPLNKKYCEIHRQVRIKEHWQNSNFLRRKGDRYPKTNPLKYILKTQKVVSIYQIMAFCNMKHKNSVWQHLWFLRKLGWIVTFRKGLYYFEGVRELEGMK